MVNKRLGLTDLSGTPLLKLAMPVFYLRAYAAFVALRTISVFVHYLGQSPWGGPLILSPHRFIPEAIAIEAGIWGLFVFVGALCESAARSSSPLKAWRAAFLILAVLLSLFSLIDFEVVRWLGQHMSASYIANFAGARDGHLFARILSSDRLYSTLAAAQMLTAVAVAVVVYQRHAQDCTRLRPRMTAGFFAICMLLLASPMWLRPSEKRWRRVLPATVGILEEVATNLSGAARPKHPKEAHQDLIDVVYTGAYGAHTKIRDKKFPLYRDDNVGQLSPAEFRQMRPEAKPDVVVIVFETMRGFNTGFLGQIDGPHAAMPLLASEFRESARYFPRVHAAGYPSVAGAMGMHLGIWPHHTRLVFSSYLHIQTTAFPEMLREAGYRSFALLGADPSFSNFTPWFRRWYDEVEYRPENHHDGPLVDRFIEQYEARKLSPEPQLLLLWTATTHPPYDVPKDAGVAPAATNEERYLQAMRYADAQLHRLIAHLRHSPRWDRTLLFILGDHAQPTPWQWTHPETCGELNPGHTWTSLGILGGPQVAPSPGRDERAVSHVDLGPTIVSSINLKIGNHFFGRDLLSDLKERPVWAFRYGAISRESGNLREIFRIDSEATNSYRFEPGDLLSYGALEGGHVAAVPPEGNFARHRDVARAWAELLDSDRLAPPPAPRQP